VADGSCACCPQPFEVNVGMVLNAFMRLSCNTGCRPGMAVNDAADGGDEAGPWYEVPPLRNRSTTISPDGLRTPVDLQGHAATIFRVQTWLELRRLPPIMGFVGSGPGLVTLLA